MSTDSWVFTKDLYPMLKELNTTAAMQIAAAPVFLQNGENMTMVKANFPLSTLNGVKWGILGENGLTTQGVGIDIVGSNAVLKNYFARHNHCAYRARLSSTPSPRRCGTAPALPKTPIRLRTSTT